MACHYPSSVLSHSLILFAAELMNGIGSGLRIGNGISLAFSCTMGGDDRPLLNPFQFCLWREGGIEGGREGCIASLV